MAENYSTTNHMTRRRIALDLLISGNGVAGIEKNADSAHEVLFKFVPVLSFFNFHSNIFFYCF